MPMPNRDDLVISAGDRSAGTLRARGGKEAIGASGVGHSPRHGRAAVGWGVATDPLPASVSPSIGEIEGQFVGEDQPLPQPPGDDLVKQDGSAGVLIFQLGKVGDSEGK
jgi:hypothetical protein